MYKIKAVHTPTLTEQRNGATKWVKGYLSDESDDGILLGVKSLLDELKVEGKHAHYIYINQTPIR